MNIYVKYNREGEILSISKVEVMPPGLKDPYVLLEDGEAVLKAPNRKALREASAMRIHDEYQVDVEQGKLVKKK